MLNLIYNLFIYYINMNYQALKSMVNNLIKSFKCNECKSNITEENIDIIWAAWNSVNIDIECPKCKKHTMVKSQILQIDSSNIALLKQNLLNLKTKIENPIKDEEMIKLSKDLKNRNINASDLFEN